MKTLSRVVAVGLFGIAPLIVATHVVYAGDADPLPQWTALSDDRLDEFRGGFLTDNGLTITLGIERLFFVNNELVSKIVLHIPQLGEAMSMLQPALEAQAQSTASSAAPSMPTNSGSASAPSSPGGGQLASSSPAPSSASSAAGTPPLASSAPATSPTTAGSTKASSAASSLPASAVSIRSPTPSVTLIQSGVRNFVDDKIAQSVGPGLATVIQNNVDKQILSAMTVVNMRISGIGSLGIANSLSTLNQQLRLSGR